MQTELHLGDHYVVGHGDARPEVNIHFDYHVAGDGKEDSSHEI